MEPPEHHITSERSGPLHRYHCTCGWATDWAHPGNATTGMAAVRHAARIERSA